MYEILEKKLKSLLDGENDFITNASNFTAMIFNEIENLNWVGFYMKTNNYLLLSCFQGKPACIKIPFDKGVCGYSYSKNQIVCIPDVHLFDGHIACDSASNSEVVFPLNIDGKLIGVLDIDSPVKNRFKDEDINGLECLLKIFIQFTDFLKIIKYYEN